MMMTLKYSRNITIFNLSVSCSNLNIHLLSFTFSNCPLVVIFAIKIT